MKNRTQHSGGLRRKAITHIAGASRQHNKDLTQELQDTAVSLDSLDYDLKYKYIVRKSHRNKS